MTEQEWITSDSYYDLLMAEPPVFDPCRRKLWLFNVACCRRMWSRFPQRCLRRLVELTESHADGVATWDEWFAQFTTVMKFLETSRGVGASGVDAHRLFGDLYFTDPAACCVIATEVRDRGKVKPVVEERVLVDLLRCIIGNPFRSVAFDPAWRTSTALALARAAYESRDFAALPILADALEDAGCGDADVLAHCRGDGPHVRGCWVVDGLLGKA